MPEEWTAMREIRQLHPGRDPRPAPPPPDPPAWWRTAWHEGAELVGADLRQATLHVGLEFKKEDLWIGVFPQRRTHNRGSGTRREEAWQHLWVCVLPCFPLHVRWKR